MRKTINPQPNLREPWLELEHARELETISSLLDVHPKLNELVLQDLRSVTPPAGSDVSRGGMSAEQVLRALLVKQLNQFTYREVAYDGAFSSKANLEAIKGKGVEDVAFTKAHFAVTDMVKSSWVYQRLRRFAAESKASFRS